MCSCSAWNNGEFHKSGAGYGLRIEERCRKIFDKSWRYILLELPNGNVVRVNLSKTFWTTCPEVRSKKIGEWLISSGYGTWPRGNPPRFQIRQITNNHFKIV